MENNIDMQSIEELKNEMLEAKMFEEFQYPYDDEPTDEQKLQVAFQTLNTNDKRDVFNQELFRIYSLFNNLIQNNTIDQKKDFRNYDSIKDQEISEDEFLNYEYQNVQMIRELILIYIATHNE